MLQDLALAMRLQALDRKISSLKAEVASLPKHIADIEQKLAGHSRRLDADRAALAANMRDRKKLEGEIQLQESKISKLRDQTLLAKTNEQYRAFQNEISYAEKEIRKAEDRILDLMESSEAFDKNVKTAEIELTKQQQYVDAEKASAREQTAMRSKELAGAQAERENVVSRVDPKLVAHYERIQKKTKGTVFAETVDGRCDACQITLRPQLLQDLRKGDQILFCESCGRMLVNNQAIDVAAEVSASEQIA